MSYVNSLSETLFLQNAMKTESEQATTLQQIVADGGQKAENFSGLSPAVGNLDLAVRGQLTRNTAYSNTIATLSTQTQSIETVLTTVDSEVNYVANNVVQLNTQDPTGSSVQQTAQSSLDQMISQYNTQSNGVSLFAGIAQNNSGATGYPITDASTIESGIQATVPAGGFTSVAQAQTAVTGYFATTSNWYVPGAAGVAGAPAQIADDRTIQASVSANPNAPANNVFGTSTRDALASVAGVAALKPSDFADYNGTTSANYTQWLTGQVSQLNQASTGINTAVAVNGIVRHDLGSEQTVNDTSTNLLQQTLTGAENQDLSTTITSLNNLQTQLQATYQVTAQLKSLSLVNFI